MKTQVEVMSKPHQSILEVGDKGYIDGYCQGGDGRPYAMVVIPKKEIVELAMVFNLKVLNK